MHIVYTMGAPRALWLAVVLVLVSWVTVGQAQHLVIGLDNKIDIDDAGKQVPLPPGKDAVVIVNIAHRGAPRIVGTLPLMNSLLGPPTNLALAVLINGSAAAKNAWYYRKGALAVLAIDGTKVTRVGEVEVGRLPEGAAFSPDGTYLYMANDLDDDLWTFKVEGTTLMRVGQTLKLPGHPASMRSSVP